MGFRSYLNGLLVFPTFFKSEVGLRLHDLKTSNSCMNKDFMIWATVSSWSCFCWLYSASPSSAANNIINLILILTIWVMSMCRIVFCVVGRECFPWLVRFLGKTLLASALLRFVLQGQICLLLQLSLDFLLFHSSPLWWKGHLFLVLVLECLVGLHRTIQLQLLRHRLKLLWYWMVCLGNEQRSFCCFWDCTYLLHFGLLLTMRATPFLLRDSCPQ